MRTEHTRYYRIKPLKWKKTVSNDFFEFWESDMGYRVERMSIADSRDWGPWKVRWCFAEYYDEGEHEVKTLAAGKRWSDEDNIKRLLPRLTELHKLTY